MTTSAAGRQPRTRPIGSFVLVLVALAVALATPLIGSTPLDPVVVAVTGGLVLLAAAAPIRYHHGDETQEVTVDEALVVVLLTLTGAWTAVILPLATTVVQVFRRQPPIKALYNGASVGVAASTAVYAFLAILGDAPPGSWPWLTASLSAAAVHTATSLLLLGLLFRRLKGDGVWETIRHSIRLNAAILVANSAVGLILALVAVMHVGWLAIGGIVLLGLHLGYRGYVAAGDQQAQVEELHRISRLLARANLEDGVFQEVLVVVGRRLGAAGVLIELDAPRPTGSRYVHGERPPQALVRTIEATRADGVPRTVAGDATPAALVVPVGHGGEVTGVLAVHGRRGLEPWTDTHLTLLGTIAHEVGVAVANLELLTQVERQRLRAQEESSKLADVLSAATDGIAVITEDGVVTTWNLGMTSITGVHPADAIGRTWWSVLRLKDRDDTELLPGGEHVVTEALAGERTLEPVPLQALRRDGHWRWTRVSFAPLVRDGAHVEGTVLVARDVTAEHELATLKADFIATVSHELRTPLTPLKGFVTTLKERDGDLDGRQRSMLVSSMQGQVNRLEQLVSDLLLVADLDRGGLTLEPGIVSLRDAIATAIHAEAPADQARVSVAPGALGSVIGDRKAIVRILRSLVSNAVKHTSGSIRIDAGGDAEHRWVTVTDDGPGIPPWEHEKVFERFHRLGDHLLRTQGPGLGLPIAKALAEELGGSLAVRSDVGAGACFTLSLPAALEIVPSGDQVEESDAV